MINLRFQILRKGFKNTLHPTLWNGVFAKRNINFGPKKEPAIKTAVLMIYSGGPKCSDEIPCFISRVMLDKSLSYGKVDKSQAIKDAEASLPCVRSKYAKLGNRSPIFLWSKSQARKLEKRLNVICTDTRPHKTFIAYQFVRPSIFDALKAIEKYPCLENIVILPMYPQYSCGLTGGCYNAIFSYFQKRPVPNVKWFVIDSWSAVLPLVKGFAVDIQEKILKRKLCDVVLIFAGHPMPPQATCFGDLYPYLVATTMMHVMKYLDYAYPYTLAWHDAPPSFTWYQPLVQKVITDYVQIQGKKNFLIVPITSVTENMITKHDYDIDLICGLGEKLGQKVCVTRVSAPNNSDTFAHAMVEVCKEAYRNPGRLPRRLTELCPLCTNKQCTRYKDWFRHLILKAKPLKQMECSADS